MRAYQSTVLGAALAALVFSVAQAEEVRTVVVARAPNGALLSLHEHVGHCVDGARAATWTSPDRKTNIPGCYKIKADDGVVSIAWMDGDSSVVPVKFFKAPEGV